MKRCSLSLIVIVIVALCAIGGAISVKYLGPDNIVEEVAENVIQQETGAHVDLSPKVSSQTAISGVAS